MSIPNYSTSTMFYKERSLITICGLCIKLYVIPLFVNDMKSVLLIDGGKGSDMIKYNKVNCNKFILTDPSIDQISIAKINKDKLHSSEVIIHRMFFLDENYVSKIHTFMNKLNISNLDIIDWQFAIHYSWSRKNHDIVISKLMDLYPKLIIISCIDGSKLFTYLNKNQILQINLEGNNNMKMVYVNQDKYIFEYLGNEVIEYYVDIDIICDALKNKYKLLYRKLFIDILNDSYTSNDKNIKHLINVISKMKLNKEAKDGMELYYNFMTYFILERIE